MIVQLIFMLNKNVGMVGGGADISSKSVNSHEFKTVTFTTKEKATYRVYLSSPYRYHVEGTVTFTWDAP